MQHPSLLFTGMVGLENGIDMLCVNFKGAFLDTRVIPLRQEEDEGMAIQTIRWKSDKVLMDWCQGA